MGKIGIRPEVGESVKGLERDDDMDFESARSILHVYIFNDATRIAAETSMEQERMEISSLDSTVNVEKEKAINESFEEDVNEVECAEKESSNDVKDISEEVQAGEKQEQVDHNDGDYGEEAERERDVVRTMRGKRKLRKGIQVGMKTIQTKKK